MPKENVHHVDAVYCREFHNVINNFLYKNRVISFFYSTVLELDFVRDFHLTEQSGCALLKDDPCQRM